jgi:hypothetical protein
MLTVSNQWADKERLKVIAALSEKLIPLLQKGRLIGSQEAYNLADRINLVARMLPNFLEANRGQILENLEK